MDRAEIEDVLATLAIDLAHLRAKETTDGKVPTACQYIITLREYIRLGQHVGNAVKLEADEIRLDQEDRGLVGAAAPKKRKT